MYIFKKINSNYYSKIKDYFGKLFKIIRRNEMRILPGNIAFFIMLSIVPIITLAGILGANFTNSFSKIIDFLSIALPKEVMDLLLPFLKNTLSHNYNAIIYLITGFVMASNGANSIIIASNTLYEVESTNYFFRRIKALFLTIILMMLFVFILIVLAFSGVIYNLLVEFKIIVFDNKLLFIFNLLKWPIAFFVIFYIVKLLYTISVDKKISSRYTNKGAMFTTLCWIILTAIYSIYTNSYARYDIFYGSLSNLIILMLWIYFLSYIFVIGIAINSSIYNSLENFSEIKNQ